MRGNKLFLLMLLLLITVLGVQAVMASGNEAGVPGDGSRSVVLVIDTSDSMFGKPMEAIKEAARQFAVQLDDNVPVALVSFSSRVVVELDYTTDKVSLLRAIGDLELGGVTALYDGAYRGVEMAAASSTDEKLVILLSDGAEYGGQSAAPRAAALSLARANSVRVYTVGLGFGADRSYLEELASGSVGGFFEAPEIANVGQVYNELLTLVESGATSVITEETSVEGESLAKTLGEDLPEDEKDEGADTVLSIPPLDLNASVALPEATQSAPAEEEASVALDAEPAATGPVIINPLTVTVVPGVGETETEEAVTSNLRGGVAVVLAVDVSDSMWGRPLEMMQEALTLFVDQLPAGIPVALVSFSNTAVLEQGFTDDKTDALNAISGLSAGGVTALYDGVSLAVQTALDSDAASKVVIVLGDGVEYGGQSEAAEDEAVLLAQVGDVTIHTVGFGFDLNMPYLETLPAETNGSFYNGKKMDDLLAAYETLAAEMGDLSTPVSITGADTITPLTGGGETDLGVVGAAPAEAIVPLDAEIAALNILGGTGASFETAAAADVTVNETFGVVGETVTPASLEPIPVDLSSNIVPLEINVPDGTDVERAELLLNGYSLAIFDAPPYTYELDASRLQVGLYELGFVIRTVTGVESRGALRFEVMVPTVLPRTGGLDSSAEAGNETVAAAEEEAATTVSNRVVDPSMPRILLVNGEAMNPEFEFTQDSGLVMVPNAPVTLSGDETLGSILSRPVGLIPAPIREAISQPRPVLASVLVIVMTVVLLPQGLFTMYWMMYTWNNPAKAEQSRSPQEFYEPHYSFTALLPARREEAVIYHTIYAVNSIDYPEDKKEVLVLIRDEDDDETIAEARRAIADIKLSYEIRGEVYPDNIKLVTFTEGPKNKPNGLNRGLKVSTKDVVCIFDAEDSPHPDIYNVINTVMIRDEADVVQSGVQLMNFESNWFSALNVLEYFFWFKSGLHCFTHSLNVTPLGGNTVFFKRHWMDQIGGWDEGCLTEDADVGIRLTNAGASIQIVYDAEHATQEETPATVQEFIKQRTRWSQGFYEIFFKFDWAKLPSLKQKVASVYILLNSLLQALIVFFLPVGLFIALTQRVPVPIALFSFVPIFLLLVQMITNLTGIREFTEAYGKKLPLGFRLRMILFYYPFQLMLSISAMRAIWRFLTNQAAWEKTSHANLHRQTTPSPAPAVARVS